MPITPPRVSPRIIGLRLPIPAALLVVALVLAGCTSTVAGSPGLGDGSASSAVPATSANSGASGASAASGQPSGESQHTGDEVPMEAAAAALPAVHGLPDDQRETWLRRASMDFELRRGENSGMVAAVGGREQYAQILLDQAAWFGKQLGAPGLRQPANALRDADNINDPSTQVGLGQAFGAPTGGGQNTGEDEWENGQRGEFADPKNPQNTVTIDDNNVSSTIHLDPYDNSQVHTEITMKKDSEMCPDPAGRMRVVYTFEIDSVSKVGGGNYHGSWIVGVTAQLDDNATIVSTDLQFQYQNGGSAGSGVELSGSGTSGGDMQPIKDGAGWAYIAAMSEKMQAKHLTDALQKTIERGKCVKLNLEASEGPDGLDTDHEVTITATPSSALDGAQANGTVQAKLTGGTQSVSPQGQKQPASPSVTVTYTSAKDQDQTGTVSFEARSLRGVGKEQMTLTTGECLVGTWAMSNESWSAVLGPVAAQYGGDIHGSGGPILTTFTKDGTFAFSFNGFTMDVDVAQGAMTVVYGGKDTGTWKRSSDGTYLITALTAGVTVKATVEMSGMKMEVPSSYQATLQPNTTLACSGDVVTVATEYGDVRLDRQQ